MKMDNSVLVAWLAREVLALEARQHVPFISGMLHGHPEFIPFLYRVPVILLLLRVKSWEAAREEPGPCCVRGLLQSLPSPSSGLYLPRGSSTNDRSESITFIYLSLAVTGKLMLMDSFFSLLSGMSFSQTS